MSIDRKKLEQQLNDFDSQTRRNALKSLLEQVHAGHITFPEQTRDFNLHCHTFFSFNGYGYSPTYLAWKGRCEGLYAMGLVDFDVLDGVDEFLEACHMVGVRACAGMETRIFVPEFGTREISSPGEPGIAYHMGVGFTATKVQDSTLLHQLSKIAQGRNQGLVDRVNAFLDPVKLDYTKDILPLVPKGNATERHVCVAYDNKARELFPDASSRITFWSEKLGMAQEEIAKVLDDGPAFQGLIRSKTMKQGGVGYVLPDGDEFPHLEEVNRFSRAAGAIPCMTWLDGTSEGEQAIDEMLDLMQASGVAAANIIPDRNWNIKDAATKEKKVTLFHEFVAKLVERQMPIIVGTEMNAYGQKFVDTFSVPEMKPLHDVFLHGTHIVYAHTLLQQHTGMGYLSEWAEANFKDVESKNGFYEMVGRKISPAKTEFVKSITIENTPEQIVAALEA